MYNYTSYVSIENGDTQKTFKVSHEAYLLFTEWLRLQGVKWRFLGHAAINGHTLKYLKSKAGSFIK